MCEFIVGPLCGRGAVPEDLVEGMFRLRYEVFHERLNWEVRTQDGIEIDEYDDPDTTYVLGYEPIRRRVQASWRLRPTTRPYMLRDTFPQLLDGEEAPSNPLCWEVSRFALDHRDSDGAADGMLRFKSLTQSLFARSIEFGISQGIQKGIWVTTPGVERMARRLGYSLQRRGRPMQMGRAVAVVQEINLDLTSIQLAEQQLGYSFTTLQEAA